mgnify:CR=1 FL=1
MYGGRSAEHEVSLRSAKSVLEHLDQQKYQAVPIAIDKQGQWLLNDLSILPESHDEAVSVQNQYSSKAIFTPAPQQELHFDVVFPVMHGTLGEDGALQGLLELANIPYVGCGVLASAMCMDKDIAKRLAQQVGVPTPKYLVVRRSVMQRLDALQADIDQQLSYPVFVKPANTGSSVGINKVMNADGLATALQAAFAFDNKVLIEQAVDAREIEIAVLQSLDDGEPLVSDIAGEVINAAGEFYTYEAKYSETSQTQLQVPAQLDGTTLTTIQCYARRIFTALECQGMARIDFFVERHTQTVYFNEINTIPGFTTISLYPRVWEVSGMPYTELLTHLIELALKNSHAGTAE